MMTACKECVHNEICDILIKTNRTINANNCTNFKNKDDYVEVVRCTECIYQDECAQRIEQTVVSIGIDYCSVGIRVTCDTCRCNKVCDHDHFGFEDCGNYIPAEDDV